MYAYCELNPPTVLRFLNMDKEVTVGSLSRGSNTSDPVISSTVSNIFKSSAVIPLSLPSCLL